MITKISQRQTLRVEEKAAIDKQDRPQVRGLAQTQMQNKVEEPRVSEIIQMLKNLF